MNLTTPTFKFSFKVDNSMLFGFFFFSRILIWRRKFSYAEVVSWQHEGLDLGRLAGGVAVQLVGAAVPLDGVQGVVLWTGKRGGGNSKPKYQLINVI